MPHRDHYKTLGVSKTASEKEIKRAYRELSKKYHPDRNPNDAKAEESFKAVQQAYSVLRDPKKRRDYDQFGDVGVGDFHTGPGGQRVYEWGGGSQVNVDDLEDLFSAFGGGGAGASPRPSIFDQMFGRGRGRGRSAPPAPVKGADVEKGLSLTFLQAALGASVTVRLRASADGGSTETIEVKVPPGVFSGQKIRIRGRGHKGQAGGPNGDLHLRCDVLGHPFFSRVGDEVRIEVPITVTEAVLGAKIEIPILDGSTSVTVPQLTSSGSKLRLKGCGIPFSGSKERGHMIVVIKVVSPESISEEQKRLYEQLREMDDSNPRKHLSSSESN